MCSWRLHGGSTCTCASPGLSVVATAFLRLHEPRHHTSARLTGVTAHCLITPYGVTYSVTGQDVTLSGPVEVQLWLVLVGSKGWGGVGGVGLDRLRADQGTRGGTGGGRDTSKTFKVIRGPGRRPAGFVPAVAVTQVSEPKGACFGLVKT